MNTTFQILADGRVMAVGSNELSRVEEPGAEGVVHASLNEILEEHMRTNLERIRIGLIWKAEEVGRTAQRLLKRLGEQGCNATVNRLGELQGTGSELDRLCAEFYFYQKELEVVTSLFVSQSKK